jgi:ketosteroid isomerase-like protein/heme-degrading monooxygenase HmoA
MRDLQNLVMCSRGARVVGVLLMIVAVAACAPQAVDQSAELAAMNDSWATALNAGDIDGLTGLYTEDCVVMPPNTEMMSGQAAARAEFGEMIDAGITMEMGTIKTVAGGNVGFHVGTYSLMTPDGTVIDRGKFIEGWQKVAGQWQIANDIWNSDWAPNAMTTTMIFTHEVGDADVWLAAWSGKPGRKGDFAEHGVPSARVFQSMENPKLVGLLVEVADMDAFQAWLNSPEGDAAKAEDTVKNATIHVFSEVD